jgi:hypothetical protein
MSLAARGKRLSSGECYGFVDRTDCAAKENLNCAIIREIIGLMQVSIAVPRQLSNGCFRGRGEISSTDVARLDFPKRLAQC